MGTFELMTIPLFGEIVGILKRIYFGLTNSEVKFETFICWITFYPIILYFLKCLMRISINNAEKYPQIRHKNLQKILQ